MAWRLLLREACRKEPEIYDQILVAVGRVPNGKLIGAENAGVNVTDRGFIPVDLQMRTNVAHITQLVIFVQTQCLLIKQQKKVDWLLR